VDIASIVFLHIVLVCLHQTDTAFIASRGGWLYCDDSSVKKTDAREVVVGLGAIFVQYALTPLKSRSAYVLFYKRTRT
jgi:ubiquitin carboxyl-terminal hydrolase 8